MKENKKGMALVVLIFIMLAFSALILGVLLLLATCSRKAADNLQYEKAFYIAEAGRVFGAKHLHGVPDWTQALGLPITRQFGGGAFGVSALNPTAVSIKIISVGVVTAEGKTYQRTVSSVLTRSAGGWNFNTDYIIFWGGNPATGGGTAQISNNVNIVGDILLKGNINLGNNATVNGDVQASGTVTGGTINGNREPNSALPADPPSVNTAYYDNLIAVANTYAAGNVTINGGTVSSDRYVHGNLTIKGNVTFSGNIKIVATGTVTLNNNVNVYASSGSVVELVANGLVTFKNNVNFCKTSSPGKVLCFSTAGFVSNNNVNIGNAARGVNFICPNSLANFANNINYYGFLYCGGTLTIGNNTNIRGNILTNAVNTISNNANLYLDPNLSDLSQIHGQQGSAAGGETTVGTWEEVF